LACAVAIEFLRQLDRLLPYVAKLGNYFTAQLEQLQSKYSSVKDVRGMGLMLAIELDSSERAKAVLSELLAKGILINRTHETVLRFLPPYIIEQKHVDDVLHALEKALHNSTTMKRSKSQAKPKQSERSH
jgi:acetylornithine aminotransferase/acetylornithine/N-succinyldiaminopimelate aminotransferase